jgi:hypothetical protein
LAIRIAKPPRVVHTDEITNAQTTHYTLEIDVPSKAVSFDEAERVRKRKTGAFFRHRKNGHFILAVESGLHTKAETGNSYRTFAVWKPAAARSAYIHDDELKETAATSQTVARSHLPAKERKPRAHRAASRAFLSPLWGTAHALTSARSPRSRAMKLCLSSLPLIRLIPASCSPRHCRSLCACAKKPASLAGFLNPILSAICLARYSSSRRPIPP